MWTGRSRAGFSLVELLLAMALGLVVVLGLVQQYAGGKAAAMQVRNAADVQDAGAYALGFLRRSAAAAGHLGCNGRNVRLENTLNGDWAELFEFDLTRPVQGFDYQGDGVSIRLDAWSPSLAVLPRAVGGGTLNALASGTGIRTGRLAAGADLVVFRRVQAPAWPLASRAAPSDNPRVMDVGADGPERGDVALISNCKQAAMFRVTGVVSAMGRLTLMRAAGAGPYDNNGVRSLSTAGLPYGGVAGPEGAQVGRVLTEVYFVAEGAGPGAVSLWRRSGAGSPAELVEGISELQVLLGVDADSQDGLDGPNRYIRFSELEPTHVIRSVSLAVTAYRGGHQRRFEQVVALRNPM